jgi:hypothetical protein
MKSTLGNELSADLNQAIDELLADGEWHGFNEFIPIADKVPSEQATRLWLSEAHRRHSSRDLSEQIERGRRLVIKRRLKYRAGRGILETQGKGFGTSYRLADQITAKVSQAITQVEKLAPANGKRSLFLTLVGNTLITKTLTEELLK